MAVQTDSLDVILRVIGARSFQTAMAESRASVAGLSKEVKKTEASYAGMGQKARIAGEAMATVAKVGLVSIGVATGYAIKNSIEFQKEMTLLQTQAGASAKDVKELHDRVLELAKVRPQGPNELAKGLYHFQSVFQNSAAAFNALEVASKGAAVGNANLEDTSTALGSALRSIFRDTIPTVKQMNGVMGQLNAIVGAGNMRMDQLTLALATGIVPAGITAGLRLKDIGGALAVLSDEGQRADNAATHLRMAFTLMGAQSKIAQKNLAAIGISANQLGTIMQQSPPGMKLVNALSLVRTQLEKKFPTFGPQLADVHSPQDALALAQRFQTISKAFGGARSSATIMLLLNNLDLLKQKTGFIPGAEQSTNKLNHAFEVWGRTADAKVKTSLSNLQAALVEFGDAIRDHAVKWITKFINLTASLIRHADTAIKIFVVWIAAWAALKVAIALSNAELAIFNAKLLLAAIWDAVTAINGLGDAFLVLGLTIEATPAGWIITAIALLIIVIALVVTHLKWFENAIKNVWNWAKEHWAFVMLLNPFLGIIALIGSKWKALKPIFKAVLDWLKPAIKVVADTASSIFTHIVGYMKSMVGAAISVINFMIRAYNKLPSFMRPTGQIMPIGGWGPNEGPNKGKYHLIPGSTPITRFQGPDATFGPANSIGTMPGGGRRLEPSLRRPRSHVPQAVAVDSPPVFENHLHVSLDGKEIFKSVTKETAKRKARK